MPLKFLISLFILIVFPILVLAAPVTTDYLFGGNVTNVQSLSEQSGLGLQDPRETIAKVINVTLAFLGVIAVVLILIAGFLWMTAAGNEEKIATAKKLMAGGVIGLIIVLAAFGIAKFVISSLISATGADSGGSGGTGRQVALTQLQTSLSLDSTSSNLNPGSNGGSAGLLSNADNVNANINGVEVDLGANSSFRKNVQTATVNEAMRISAQSSDVPLSIVGNNYFSVTVTDASNSAVTDFSNNPITLRFDISNISAAGRNNLQIAWFNETARQWELATGGRVEGDEYVIEVDHLTIFAVVNRLPRGQLQDIAVHCTSTIPMITIRGWSYDPDNLSSGHTDVHFYDKDFSQATSTYLFNLSASVNVESFATGTATAIRDMGIIRGAKQETYAPVPGIEYGFSLTAAIPNNFSAGDIIDLNAYAINIDNIGNMAQRNTKLSRYHPERFSVTAPNCQNGLAANTGGGPGNNTQQYSADNESPVLLGFWVNNIIHNQGRNVVKTSNPNVDVLVGGGDNVGLEREELYIISQARANDTQLSCDDYLFSVCRGELAASLPRLDYYSLNVPPGVFYVGARIFDNAGNFTTDRQAGENRDRIYGPIKILSQMPSALVFTDQTDLNEPAIRWSLSGKTDLVERLELWRYDNNNAAAGWVGEYTLSMPSGAYSISRIGDFQYGLHIVMPDGSFATEQDYGLDTVRMGVAPEGGSILQSFSAEQTSPETVNIRWSIDESRVNEIDHFEIWRMNFTNIVNPGAWEMVSTEAPIPSSARDLNHINSVGNAGTVARYQFGIHVVMVDGSYLTEQDAGLRPISVVLENSTVNNFGVIGIPISCENGEQNFYGQCVDMLKIIGQKNYQETSRDTVSGKAIYHAAGVVVDTSSSPNKVYVADAGNNRILGFDGIGYCRSTTTKCTTDRDCPGSVCEVDGTKDPEIVFGQPDFSSAACNGDNNKGMINGQPTDETLCFMAFPVITNVMETWQRLNFDVDLEGNLYVPDWYNNRVLRYNRPFGTNRAEGERDAVADFVWGQPDFNSRFKNYGAAGINNRGLHLPYCSPGDCGDDHMTTFGGVSADPSGAYIWVADTNNNRVLRFPVGGKEADIVIGQENFNSRDSTACAEQVENYQDIVNTNKNFLCRPSVAKINPVDNKLYVLEEPLFIHPPALGRWPFAASMLVYAPPFNSGMEAARVLIPKQWESRNALNINNANSLYFLYFFQSSGFIFDKEGRLIINEHQTSRTILMDTDGTILNAIGATDWQEVNTGMCAETAYTQCQQNIYNDFHVCWPGGSIGIDTDDNIYLASEFGFRISRYHLPYSIREENGQRCMPNPNGGLFREGIRALDWTPNSVGPAKFSEGIGVAAYAGQLIVRDKRRLMAWNSYISRPVAESAADYVIGQVDPYARQGSILEGSRSLLSGGVDDQGRLWMFNGQGEILIFQLPFINSGPNSGLLTQQAGIYWIDDDQSRLSFRDGSSFAFDPSTSKMWINDFGSSRILRISDYNGFEDGRLEVDLVIGQRNKEDISCNHNQQQPWRASGNPTAESLCYPWQSKFDKHGNLFVVEGNYECHSNNRIIMFQARDIASASARGRLFPQIAITARKVFISNSLTQAADCNMNRENEPSSPVSIAFDNDNHMIVGNDGYYSNYQDRAFKQLYYYENPLETNQDGTYVQGQKPDGYINIPMGAPGEMYFDEQDNLIIQDHTWQRVWVINLEQDPAWLVPIN